MTDIELKNTLIGYNCEKKHIWCCFEDIHYINGDLCFYYWNLFIKFHQPGKFTFMLYNRMWYFTKEQTKNSIVINSKTLNFTTFIEEKHDTFTDILLYK